MKEKIDLCPDVHVYEEICEGGGISDIVIVIHEMYHSKAMEGTENDILFHDDIASNKMFGSFSIDNESNEGFRLKFCSIKILQIQL